MPRTAAPRLPGAVTEAQEPETAANEPTDEPTEELTPAAAALVAKMAAKMVERELAKHGIGGAAAPSREAPLPHERDIDPTKITAPVLTHQGYVVPVGYGEPASGALASDYINRR